MIQDYTRRYLVSFGFLVSTQPITFSLRAESLGSSDIPLPCVGINISTFYSHCFFISLHTILLGDRVRCRAPSILLLQLFSRQCSKPFELLCHVGDFNFIFNGGFPTFYSAYLGATQNLATTYGLAPYTLLGTHFLAGKLQTF